MKVIDRCYMYYSICVLYNGCLIRVVCHTNSEVIHLGHYRDGPAELHQGVCQLSHGHQRLTPHRLSSPQQVC